MSAPPPEQVPAAPAVSPAAARRGVQAVTAETFSFSDAVGGVRGVIEALLPGTLFVVVYVVATNLTWALGAAVGAALVAVVLRLAQRTPVTQALGGLLGIGVGVIWAWRSGEAGNFFAWGLWTNAIYLVAVLLSIVVRWPAVGLVVEGMRAGFTADTAKEQAADGASPFAALVAWRKDRALVRRYTAATWLWVGMFGLRLAVQLPLYLDNSVGWLGTARLVLGVPLWGLVLWLTWAVVRGAHGDEVEGADDANDARESRQV
ncbi:hypothetical protein Xcel_1919 [Xylanimonas cellulosilytica DSM 15894]|uniref:DUF3159 domain-containing protein n=1 Tax=Xylanimonas cellulosilytica (strain DSM 15894 / JCM 12276 / CECT 5975 / KCTC 9989 / LMG 20990 / NBRC 107835 / XIL07) TaxID=446471 RepID=D1BT96_XYLCX|nr:DUF3159 domain-containing protein [Xylanimonas cellulosilytica]ACZ30938.1 hypothetical protein Xcel_1919 [Xylanimonas cellulosilytica DSM 15894]